MCVCVATCDLCVLVAGFGCSFLWSQTVGLVTGNNCCFVEAAWPALLSHGGGGFPEACCDRANIGTVLAVAKTPKRKANLEIAQKLAAAAHKGDAYTAGALLVPFEKDKAALAVFLGDFIAFVGAGLYGTAPDTLHGRAAARAIRAVSVLQTQIAANVNTKAALTLFAIRLGKVNTVV